MQVHSNESGSQTTTNGETHWFRFLYQTRIKILRKEVTIINLSLAFAILAAVSAPWVAAAGLAIAFALGYRIEIERSAPEFSGNFHEVVRDAAENVQEAIDQVVKNSKNQS